MDNDNKEIKPITLTVQEVAKYTGFKLRKVYNLCRTKSFPAVKFGHDWYIHKDLLDEWFMHKFKKK